MDSRQGTQGVCRVSPPLRTSRQLPSNAPPPPQKVNQEAEGRPEPNVRSPRQQRPSRIRKGPRSMSSGFDSFYHQFYIFFPLFRLLIFLALVLASRNTLRMSTTKSTSTWWIRSQSKPSKTVHNTFQYLCGNTILDHSNNLHIINSPGLDICSHLFFC
jgi:hypothetical protein